MKIKVTEMLRAKVEALREKLFSLFDVDVDSSYANEKLARMLPALINKFQLAKNVPNAVGVSGDDRLGVISSIERYIASLDIPSEKRKIPITVFLDIDTVRDILIYGAASNQNISQVIEGWLGRDLFYKLDELLDREISHHEILITKPAVKEYFEKRGKEAPDITTRINYQREIREDGAVSESWEDTAGGKYASIGGIATYNAPGEKGSATPEKPANPSAAQEPSKE